MQSKSPLSDKTKKTLVEVETSLCQLIKTDNKIISEAASKTLTAGGKRLRPALVLLCGGQENIKKIMPVAVSVEMVHMASLVHDDLLDKTATRRGEPTVTEAYGQETAIKVGDYLFSKAFEKITETKNTKVISIIAKSSIDLTIGEILQQKTAYNPKQSESLYLIKSKFKTGSLFEAACRMAAILTEKKENEIEAYSMYGLNLGLAFQLFDDILDVTGDEGQMGKPAGSDLYDGIVTLPYLFAMDEDGDNKVKIENVIKDKDPSKQRIKEVINIVKTTDSINITKEKAVNYIKYAIGCLDKISDKNSAAELKAIAEFVIDRYH